MRLNKFENYTAETWLFGFWGTDDYFDPHPDLKQKCQDHEVNWMHFDNEQYEREVAKACFQVSMSRIEEAFGFRPEITFQRVGGKRHDGLYVKVKVTKQLAQHLHKYINQRFSNFYDWIKSRYSPRSEFIPYHSSDAYEWANETNDFVDFQPDSRKHKLGACLKFCVIHDEAERNEEWEQIDIYYEASEKGCPYPPVYYSEPQVA